MTDSTPGAAIAGPPVRPHGRPRRWGVCVLALWLVAACSGSETIRPTPAVTLSGIVLPTGVVGTGYSHTLAANGGDGSFTWSLASGALPPGLALASSGTLTGTPTLAGTSAFTVRVTSADQAATANLELTVVDPLQIATTTLPTGRTGTSYAVALTATGGTGSYAWSVASGGLPPGLTLDASGILSGTPVAPDARDVTVQVVSGDQTVTRVLSLEVFDPLSVVTTGLPEGIVGVAYGGGLEAAGGNGPYRWRLAEGALPPGLALDTLGALSGTPTTAETAAFTVEVTSGEERVSRAFQLAVVEPLVITSTVLPSAPRETLYRYALDATGGTGSYGWSVAEGALPPGIELSETGVLEGTTPGAGSFAFTAEVLSGSQSARRAFGMEVVDRLTILTENLEPGITGTAYSQTLESAGGLGEPTWSVVSGSLPEGIELDGSGTLAGTPTGAGEREFTVQAAAGDQTATARLRIQVFDPLVISTPSPLPEGVVGTAYKQTLAATGGTGDVTWSLASGALPAGLTLDAAGVFAGTPEAPGTRTFEVQARSGTQSATATLALPVVEPLVLAPGPLALGQVGAPYLDSVTVTGGIGSYDFTLRSGTLPGGIELSPGTGRISGTPSEAGTFSFSVEVASGSQTDDEAFTLTVEAPPCALDDDLDTDGDRLPDCAETNTGVFRGPTDTGTNPAVRDTDGDGIDDGDEVLGTLDGLDLPAMGANPLQRNILIEYDWFDDDEGGPLHSHRPSPATIAKVAAFFAAAPLDNPDGSLGIVAIQDYGQGGPFDGGGRVDDPDGCLVSGVSGTEYAGYVNGNFAPERLGYFHYSLVVHRYGATAAGSCAGASASSGQAFYNDHRSLISSSTWHNGGSGDQWVANTIAHEVGHNLNLSHGGPRNDQAGLNYKPNYPSVMNYRYQFSGIDTGCDVTADGFLDYSSGTRVTLDESAVDESVGVCGDVPLDWNRNGDATDSGFALDLQAYDDGPGTGTGNGSEADVLEDHDDWANITLAGSVQGAALPGGASLYKAVETCTSAPPTGR